MAQSRGCKESDMTDYRDVATKGVVKGEKSENKKEYEESPRATATKRYF